MPANKYKGLFLFAAYMSLECCTIALLYMENEVRNIRYKNLLQSSNGSSSKGKHFKAESLHC